jgi:hypothetical protein
MDAVKDDCDVQRTLIVAPSFGGHLAILHAHADARVCGIVTVGAPLIRFFTDADQRRAIPEITRAALMRAARIDGDALDRHLTDLALLQPELSGLPVKVTYIASLRDEIIPQGEWRDAAALTRSLCVYPFDDVHGAPHHLRQTRFLILAALLRHAGRPKLAWVIERVLRWTLGTKPHRS